MELIRNKEEVLEMQKATLIQVGIEGAVQDLEAGIKDPSELLIIARKASEILGAYMAQLREAVTDELYRNGSNQVLKVYGAEIALGSTGDRLDYASDHEYSLRLKALKDREAMLKLASISSEPLIDSEGGIIEAVPLKSASKEILKVKL